MTSFILSPVTDFLQQSELSKSGSIPSFWSHPHGYLKRQSTLRSKFRRRRQVQDPKDQHQEETIQGELYKSGFNYSAIDDGISVMNDMESYLENQTPVSKIKLPTSALQNFRELIREHSPRKRRLQGRLHRPRGIMLRRQNHQHSDHRFRLFKHSKKKMLDIEQHQLRLSDCFDYDSATSRATLENEEESISSGLTCDVEEDMIRFFSPPCYHNVSADNESQVSTGVMEIIDQVTQFSPVHELPFETLELLSKKIFALPDLFYFTQTVEDAKVPMGLVSESDEDTLTEDTDIPDAEIHSSPPTPECVRDLFAETVSTNDGGSFPLPASSDSTYSFLPNLYESEASLSSIPDTTPQSWRTLHRAFTYIERMRSIIVGEQELQFVPEGNLETLSTDSNYTPVPVTVPTLRRPSFLGELVETISGGDLIEPLYRPETRPNLISRYDVDENTPLTFMDSGFFEPPTPSNKGAATLSPCPRGTIKFDTFSHVLFYNKDASIQCEKTQINARDVTGTHPYEFGHSLSFRKQGDLYLAQQDRRTFSRRSKFSKFTKHALQGYSVSNSLEESMENDLPKSILRSRHNRNVDQESVRLAACDSVDIHDFMTFFDTSEQERFDFAPLLDGMREEQLHTYYKYVEEQNTKQIEVLDSLSDQLIIL